MCVSFTGRWSQWLSPFIHSRGVCDGPSTCSSLGWQCSRILQHERVCVYGESKQEPGTRTYIGLKTWYSEWQLPFEFTFFLAFSWFICLCFCYRLNVSSMWVVMLSSVWGKRTRRPLPQMWDKLAPVELMGLHDSEAQSLLLSAATIPVNTLSKASRPNMSR